MSLSSAAANAGLCAALAAAERGTRVLLLERAPESERGGNSFVTPGVFRFPYEGVEDVARLVDDPLLGSPERVQIGRYPEDEFYQDSCPTRRHRRGSPCATSARVYLNQTNRDHSVDVKEEVHHAMLWHGTAASALDLHAFLPPGFAESEALGVDSTGEILGVAWVYDSGGNRENHYFLWMPAKKPGSPAQAPERPRPVSQLMSIEFPH